MLLSRCPYPQELYPSSAWYPSLMRKRKARAQNHGIDRFCIVAIIARPPSRGQKSDTGIKSTVGGVIHSHFKKYLLRTTGMRLGGGG